MLFQELLGQHPVLVGLVQRPGEHRAQAQQAGAIGAGREVAFDLLQGGRRLLPFDHPLDVLELRQ